MKKRMIALLLCMTTILTLGACGSNHNQGETQQGTEVQNNAGGLASADIDIDLEKQVTKLADYKGIPLTVTGSYDVTDEEVESNLLSLLSYYGIYGVEVKDRDTVKKEDYVLIDYSGYLDGEAFEGGTATDIMFDISNNYDLTNGSGYIDGFADGLVGAKVGEEASSDVTFPDDYNETLGGKQVVFKFDIKGIYEPITIDTLTDDIVAENFTDLNLATKKDLLSYVRDALESQMESTKKQAGLTAAQDYMLENSTVEIPEEYMQARLAEYQTSLERDYCSENQTLEEYLAENGTSIEAELETWNEILDKQIKLEFIFGRIAELEKIEVDEDAYGEFVNYIISSNSSQMSTQEDVYNYYGNGNKENGEKMLRELYLVNQALSFVVDNADVTVAADTQAQEDTQE